MNRKERKPVRSVTATLLLSLIWTLSCSLFFASTAWAIPPQIPESVQKLLTRHTESRKTVSVPPLWKMGGIVGLSLQQQKCALGMSANPLSVSSGDFVTVTVTVPEAFSALIQKVSIYGYPDMGFRDASRVGANAWKAGFQVLLDPQVRYASKPSFRASAFFTTDMGAQVMCAGEIRLDIKDAMSISLQGPSYLELDKPGTWTATVEGGTPPYTYTFEWGESTESPITIEDTSLSRTHTFSKAQLRSVYAAVSDSTGKSVFASDLVTIVGPITVSLNGPTSLIVGQNGTWTATGSGGYGGVESYTMYVDGIHETYCGLEDQCAFSKSFSKAGTHEAKVVAEDIQKNSAATTLTVEVEKEQDSSLPYITRCTIQIGVQGTFLYTPKSGGDPTENTRFWEARWSAVGNFSGETFSGTLDQGDNTSGNLSVNIIDHPDQSGSEILGSFEASATFKTDIRTTTFKTEGTYNGSEIWDGGIYVSGGEANNYINPFPKTYMKSEDDWGTEELLSFSSDDRNYLCVICAYE